MNKPAIFKVIAITNFVLLFTVFLMFRNGSFDSYFYKNIDNNFTSPNGGVGTKYNTDSLKAKIDSIQRLQKAQSVQNVRFSSSKSLVAIDYMDLAPRREIKKDSSPVYPTDKEKSMMQRPMPEILNNSKPGTTIDLKLIALDSMLKEKEKQKKQQ